MVSESVDREDITQEKMQAVFQKIDTNGDGVITPTEYYRFLMQHGDFHMEANQGQDFLGADYNGLNEIDFPEFERAVSRWYRNKDSNDPDVRLVESIFRRF